MHKCGGKGNGRGQGHRQMAMQGHPCLVAWPVASAVHSNLRFPPWPLAPLPPLPSSLPSRRGPCCSQAGLFELYELLHTTLEALGQQDLRLLELLQV